MVKCLPEFEYFTVFLKNKNIIFKIRRSKVTDYAALRIICCLKIFSNFSSGGHFCNLERLSCLILINDSMGCKTIM